MKEFATNYIKILRPVVESADAVMKNDYRFSLFNTVRKVFCLFVSYFLPHMIKNQYIILSPVLRQEHIICCREFHYLVSDIITQAREHFIELFNLIGVSAGNHKNTNLTGRWRNAI